MRRLLLLPLLLLACCGGEDEPDAKTLERQRVCENLAIDSGRYRAGTKSFEARVDKCVRDLERIMGDGG
jgi:hypothetical protein